MVITWEGIVFLVRMVRKSLSEKVLFERAYVGWEGQRKNTNESSKKGKVQ